MSIRWFLLTWDQVERARGPLDVEPARAEVAAVIAEHSDGVLSDYVFAECVSRVLVERYGAWAVGWCWDVGDGGLVSVRHPADTPDIPSRRWRRTDRVLAALQQWHTTIEALAREFEDLRPPDDAPIGEVVEFAAAILVDWVLTRTEANDAWQRSFTTVLAWYLQAWALADVTAEAELERVVSGKFESWMVPTAAVIQTTCAELGATVVRRYDSVPRDATLEWIDTRRRVFTSDRATPLRSGGHPPNDGHLRFIDGVEHRRDPVRADRMRAALRSCRESAFAGEPLDLALLARWNAILLGQPSSAIRETEAYAKGGRERYGTAFEDQTLIAYIAEANDSAGQHQRLAMTPRAVRAARVYLDVCFFHPFADGNARTARLALDHVLARDHYGLHLAEPVFTLARAANDVRGADRFIGVIMHLTVRLP